MSGRRLWAVVLGVDRARRSAVAIARRESRHLAVRLDETGSPLPRHLGCRYLARVLAERDVVRYTSNLLFAGLIILLLLLGVGLLTLPFWIGGSGDDAFKVALLSLLVTYAASAAIAALNLWLDRQSLDSKRRQLYLPRRGRFSEAGLINFSIVSIPVAGVINLIPAIEIALTMPREQLFDAALTSAGAVVWTAMLLMPATRMGDRRLAALRAPHGEVVRHLANAFTLVVDSRPPAWRSVKCRLTAASQLAAAANVLEGRYRSSLTRFAIHPDAPAWEVAGERVLRLRGLAAQLALSDADQQPSLARLIGEGLIAALAGRPGEMPATGLAFSSPGAAAFQRKAGSTRRWIVTTLVPAIILIVLVAIGKIEKIGWIVQNESTFVQLALIVLMVGTTAAIDPSGYDKRIGAVTGAGGALFGWGKAKS